jgi:signal transduction histidine kinase
MRRMVPCDRCSVILFDVRRGQAQMIAGFGAGAYLEPVSLSLTDLSSANALRQGTVRYIEDLSMAEDLAPLYRQLLAAGMRTVLSVPLLVEAEAIGVITLSSPTPSAFDSEHRDIALEVATPIAIAIQHARLREELARQTAELEHRVAERSAAVRAATAELETVLYSVSHDLRAPLRHLLGFCRLMLEETGPELPASALHYAKRIHEAADRMNSLVDDLVTLSRLGRQDLLRRRLDLTPLVEDVVGQLGSAANGRSIEWQIEELPTVEGDPNLIKMAVTNLLSNAVKFTRPRDRAVIRVWPIDADGQVGIAITDNGVGFRMAYAGKLFGMFQRLHRADEFEGNGAGLAVVQRIVHKHGGRVWAEAEPDKGATFYLTLGSGDVGKQGSGSSRREDRGTAAQAP